MIVGGNPSVHPRHPNVCQDHMKRAFMQFLECLITPGGYLY